MNERVKFVAAMLQAEETFAELRERFGISRKQGYSGRNATRPVAWGRWSIGRGHRIFTRTP